jgi:hypothetical protein
LERQQPEADLDAVLFAEEEDLEEHWE